MRVKVKICGMTSREAVRAAVEAGADALGFVFAKSPREIEPGRAAELARDVPPSVARVAVFHHPSAERVEHVLSCFGPDLIQSDAEDAPRFAGRARTPFVPVLRDRAKDNGLPEHDPATWVDAPGRDSLGFRPTMLFESLISGSGTAVDWERARDLAARARLVLAGGLSPENVAEAIARVRPYAVDVSSGVELRRGLKDPGLVSGFIRAVRQAEAALPTPGRDPA